eukprot:338843-Rhodomonas_salina.1
MAGGSHTLHTLNPRQQPAERGHAMLASLLVFLHHTLPLTPLHASQRGASARPGRVLNPAPCCRSAPTTALPLLSLSRCSTAHHSDPSSSTLASVSHTARSRQQPLIEHSPSSLEGGQPCTPHASRQLQAPQALTAPLTPHPPCATTPPNPSLPSSLPHLLPPAPHLSLAPLSRRRIA